MTKGMQQNWVHPLLPSHTTMHHLAITMHHLATTMHHLATTTHLCASHHHARGRAFGARFVESPTKHFPVALDRPVKVLKVVDFELVRWDALDEGPRRGVDREHALCSLVLGALGLVLPAACRTGGENKTKTQNKTNTEEHTMRWWWWRMDRTIMVVVVVAVAVVIGCWLWLWL